MPEWWNSDEDPVLIAILGILSGLLLGLMLGVRIWG